jgi:hypothetical protein
LKAKIEDIFLAYANHSIIGNPKNFHTTVDAIDKVFPNSDELKSLMNQSIELLIRFAKFNDFSKANTYREKIRKNYNPFILEPNFEYVYGYEGGVCYGYCQQGKTDRPKVIESKKFTGPDRLKCFECDQAYFNYVLTNIVNGKEYSKIVDLTRFLSLRQSLIKTQVTISPRNTDKPFKEELVKRPLWEPLLVNFFFYGLIGGVVSYSLSEFLIKDNRIKLRLCDHCKKFFVASKADLRIKFCSDCSPKSKKTKAEKAEYMKQYNIKKKQDRISQEREAKIIHYIDNLDCTREEAIKIIEADAMM